MQEAEEDEEGRREEEKEEEVEYEDEDEDALVDGEVENNSSILCKVGKGKKRRKWR